MENEIWKDIPSLPEYEASSLGRIRCHPTKKAMPKGGIRTYGGKPWLGCWAKDAGRYIFRFRGKTYKVAPLICEAFHGPAPFPYPLSVCMHLDENARNNRPENLAWGSQQDNLNAPGFLEYCRSRRGLDNPFVKGRAK
jgi:hypothetical protein